jgi:hypothetical protein
VPDNESHLDWPCYTALESSSESGRLSIHKCRPEPPREPFRERFGRRLPARRSRRPLDGLLRQVNPAQRVTAITPDHAVFSREPASERVSAAPKPRSQAARAPGRPSPSPRPVLHDVNAALASGTTNPYIIQRAFVVGADYCTPPSHIKAPVGTPGVRPRLCPD